VFKSSQLIRQLFSFSKTDRKSNGKARETHKSTS
jgi:hypothetical protein